MKSNKIKEREHSNKWDPSVRFFKEPLLWEISTPCSQGNAQSKFQIRQGQRETLKPQGPFGSFFKGLSFGNKILFGNLLPEFALIFVIS